jgi:hypothetical protein
MTQKEKELLLQVICMMLPYGVRVKLNGRRETSNKLTIDWLYAYSRHIEDIKPYLRPMSSMTEEEKVEYDQLCYNCQEQDSVDYNITQLDRTQLIYVIDWLNAHHFDYRGLIPMGLALPAPEYMYATKSKSTTTKQSHVGSNNFD